MQNIYEVYLSSRGKCCCFILAVLVHVHIARVCIYERDEVWDVARLKKYKQNPNPLRVADLIYLGFCWTSDSIYLECQVLDIESNFFLWRKRKWRVIPKGILVADATVSL